MAKVLIIKQTNPKFKKSENVIKHVREYLLVNKPETLTIKTIPKSASWNNGWVKQRDITSSVYYISSTEKWNGDRSITFTLRRKHNKMVRREHLGCITVMDSFHISGYYDTDNKFVLFTDDGEDCQLVKNATEITVKGDGNYITEIEVWVYSDKPLTDKNGEVELIGAVHGNFTINPNGASMTSKARFDLDKNKIIDLEGGRNKEIKAGNIDVVMKRIGQLMGKFKPGESNV